METETGMEMETEKRTEFDTEKKWSRQKCGYE
jgi:hypothetical protein